MATKNQIANAAIRKARASKPAGPAVPMGKPRGYTNAQVVSQAVRNRKMSMDAPKVRTGSASVGSKGSSIGNKIGNFVKNELLGVDDFNRMNSAIGQHHWRDALKSGATGGLELGSTVASVGGAAFSGGTSLSIIGGKVAQMGAKQVVKAGVKAAAKQGVKDVAKTVTKRTAGSVTKSVIKTAATGSLKTGAKNVGRVAVKPVTVTGRKVVIGAGKVAERGLAGAAKRTAAKPINVAVRRAATSTAKAEGAINTQKAATASLKTLKAGAKGKRPVKGTAAATRAQTAAKNTASEASRVSRSANARVSNLQKAAQSKAVNTAARKKIIKKGARRLQYAHVTVASNSRKGK